VPGKDQFTFRAYWDTCVFVSLFDGGKGRTREELEGLNFWADRVDEGTVLVVTSTLTLAEVLEFNTPDARLSAAEYRAFETFVYDHKRVELVGIDLGAILRTKHLREFHHNNKISPSLRTPDAIHLATAANGATDAEGR
jgi:predicted nucleic acid-binding protein